MLETYKLRAEMGEEEARYILDKFRIFFYHFEGLYGNWTQTDFFNRSKTHYTFSQFNGITAEYFNELKGYKEFKYFESKNDEFESFVFSRYKKYRQDYLMENFGISNKNKILNIIKKIKDSL